MTLGITNRFMCRRGIKSYWPISKKKFKELNVVAFSLPMESKTSSNLGQGKNLGLEALMIERP
jgi:hypothetical protein